MVKLKELSKDERIKEEIKRLGESFKYLPKEKRDITDKLINRASFLLILLEDLEKEINNNELTSGIVNGGQFYIRTNPAIKEYNTTVKSYQSIIKQLSELQPTDANATDEMLDFIKGK